VDTGYSCVEIVGESDELLAVHVTDGVDESHSSASETESRLRVEFEPVPRLTEATVKETSVVIEERHGLESENLVTIGPAGENLVRYAALMTSDSRAFGRGGLGTVLGSKNVKTVSFRGDSRPTVEIPDDGVVSDVHRDAATKDHIMKRQGTTSGVDLKNDMFSLPTKYFERMDFDEGVDGIDGSAVESKKYKKGTCSLCAFACKLPTRDDETGLQNRRARVRDGVLFRK